MQAIGPRAVRSLAAFAQVLDRGCVPLSQREELSCGPGQWLVVLLDGSDEARLDEVRTAIANWRARGRGPTVVAYRFSSDGHERYRTAHLRRLTQAWDTCVIAAPNGDFEPAVDVIARPLLRLGLVGFDAVDLAWLLTAPCAGELLVLPFTAGTPWKIPDAVSVRLHRAHRVLLVIHCSPAVTLFDINAISESVARAIPPNVPILIACPEALSPQINIISIH